LLSRSVEQERKWRDSRGTKKKGEPTRRQGKYCRGWRKRARPKLMKCQKKRQLRNGAWSRRLWTLLRKQQDP